MNPNEKSLLGRLYSIQVFNSLAEHIGHKVSIESETGAELYFCNNVELYPVRLTMKCKTCGQKIVVYELNEERDNVEVIL